MQGGPFGEKTFFSKKKSRSAEKNERGESLVSPGMVCYAEKQEKPFWFSSLVQIVHFDAIIFCRTFVELFWSVHVDRKKRVTIIVVFHFMKRRLKRVTIIVAFHFMKRRLKNKGEPLETLKCFGKMSHKAEKGPHSAENNGRGTFLLWNGFVVHVRGFGCV